MKKLYICVGERYIEGIRNGFCGDIHFIKEWLNILFPNQKAIEYFEGYTVKEIVKYILETRGKRLEPYKLPAHGVKRGQKGANQ